jgi:hypothetical protein
VSIASSAEVGSGVWDDVARGIMVMVEAKWPVWKTLRCNRRSPFDESGSIGMVSKPVLDG